MNKLNIADAHHTDIFGLKIAGIKAPQTTTRSTAATTTATAPAATAPAASATTTAAPSAGAERRADDRAGGQPTDRADGETRRAGPEPAAAGPPGGLLLLRVRVAGGRLLRRVAVRPRGRRWVSLSVVGDVVVLPGRLLGALRAPERRDRRNGHCRGHREHHDGHGADVPAGYGVVHGEKTRPHHGSQLLPERPARAR